MEATPHNTIKTMLGRDVRYRYVNKTNGREWSPWNVVRLIGCNAVKNYVIVQPFEMDGTLVAPRKVYRDKQFKSSVGDPLARTVNCVLIVEPATPHPNEGTP